MSSETSPVQQRPSRPLNGVPEGDLQSLPVQVLHVSMKGGGGDGVVVVVGVGCWIPRTQSWMRWHMPTKRWETERILGSSWPESLPYVVVNMRPGLEQGGR